MKNIPFPQAVLFILPVLVFLSACQSQPKAPPSLQQLTAYAEAIRSQQIADITQFRECYSLGGEISQLAADSRESWHFINDALITAADSQLALSRNDWVSIDDQRYSLTSLRQVIAIAEEARSKLNLNKRSPNNQKIACQRALTPLQDRDFTALADEPRLTEALIAKHNRMPPTPGGEVQFNKFAQGAEPGRSYYSITESLRASCATDMSLIALVNDWPKEHYGAFCQGEPLALVSCEWGNCQQHKPENDL